MDSESIIKKFDSIDGNVTKMKTVTVCLAVVMGLVILGSVMMAFSFARSRSEMIYVLDQGKSLIALQTNEQATVDQEVRDHVKQFHEYFFNLAPNEEAISQNCERAYLLCDGSARKYYNDLQENNYYNRLISNNIVQYVYVDSILVDTKVYPYRAAAYCTLSLQRSSSVTRYDLVTTCNVVKMQRSQNNMHGMMMENFAVVAQTQKQIQSR